MLSESVGDAESKHVCHVTSVSSDLTYDSDDNSRPHAQVALITLTMTLSPLGLPAQSANTHSTRGLDLEQQLKCLLSHTRLMSERSVGYHCQHNQSQMFRVDFHALTSVQQD